MAADFSSVIGHVDESIEQRASLLAALRAKLDGADGNSQSSPAGDGQPALLLLAEDSGDVQEVEVPAVPAPPVIEVDDEDSPSAAPADTFSDVMAQLDKGLDQRQQMIDALKAQLDKSAPKSHAPRTHAHAMPAALLPVPAPPALPAPPRSLRSLGIPAVSSTGVGHGGHGPGNAPSFAALGMGALGVPVTPMTPIGSVHPMVQPLVIQGEPPTKRFRPEAGVPLPLRAPMQDHAAREAEQAALAARKAQMLRSLGADVSRPELQARLPQAPSVPEPPPGASPEEFEAYRQQCWRQYFQWCKVWQKYYDQSKGAKGQGSGPCNPSAAQATNGKGSKGRPAHQVQRHSVEDDIHSKLLGL
ncbi:unnamed protein product [Effrenium voratum]|nr:unnamed protein product [Effrenium voratum]|mmetsp:Transcript_51283/g.122947  ORF Transcript_51283/g.122947 Transcript_51283/m.122947 type:complete len:359 (+) Transcript_51283:24-1100(+)